MKKTRFSEEQIIALLREQEGGMNTGDVCRKLGISSATLYAWKAKYGGMDVSQARKLRVLEQENGSAQTAAGRRHARQRRAEGSRGKKLVKPAAQRKAVEHARQLFGTSERRACTIFAVDRTSMRMRIDVVVMATCGRGFARSRPNVVASATGGLGSCWSARGWS